jgi:hypothetical protein
MKQPRKLRLTQINLFMPSPKLMCLGQLAHSAAESHSQPLGRYRTTVEMDREWGRGKKKQEVRSSISAKCLFTPAANGQRDEGMLPRVKTWSAKSSNSICDPRMESPCPYKIQPIATSSLRCRQMRYMRYEKARMSGASGRRPVRSGYRAEFDIITAPRTSVGP